MTPENPSQPVNLTAAVELGRLIDGPVATQVLSSKHLAFTIHNIDGLATIAERAETDILYMIIAGYGVLHCADGERIEFTAGDLLMVPAGAIHRFEEVALKFKIWRIEVGNPAEPAIEDEGSALPSK